VAFGSRGGAPTLRGVYSDAMRIRTISLVALGVAGVIAAVAIIAAPAFSTPATARAAAAGVAKPPVVKKYVRYGDGRKSQMADYSQRHYRQHTYELTDPKAIVLHHTAGSTWQSAWNTFDGNAAYNDEKPGVSAQFIIHKDGTIYQCMPLDLRARHCIGMNWKSIGIEFVQEARSGKDGHWMDKQILDRDKQVNAGIRLVRYLKTRFGILNRDIVGHATANGSRFFKDYTGAKNSAGDWYAAEVRVFRSRL
jgi:N-acetylmuramoyl-L-alanine amidase